MRAIQIDQYGGADGLALRDIPAPEPGAGEVLVELKIAGLNFIDVYMREGKYRDSRTYGTPLPFTLGMEGAAESMTQGYVDANWAKEHHNLWYAEMERAGMVDVEPNALEEIKRHDDIDFKGFGSPGSKASEG